MRKADWAACVGASDAERLKEWEKEVGWKVSSSLHTDLALDALDMGIYLRRRSDEDLAGSVHHSDRGIQYRSIRYGQALAEQDVVASVESRGDSYNNGLA